MKLHANFVPVARNIILPINYYTSLKRLPVSTRKNTSLIYLSKILLRS